MRYGQVVVTALMLTCTAAASAQAVEAAASGEAVPAEASKYYFISDLHIGGDGDLNDCSFEQELIDFLQMLEGEPPRTELIIVGDAFGLWELSQGQGPEKFQCITSTHRALFDQFRRTGAQIRITLMVGNHDYDLACYPAYREILAGYGIHLEPRVHIERRVAGRRLWIEHGNQHDEANRFPRWGDPFGQPVGYFITSSVVAASGRGAAYAKSPWLSELESVYPTEAIPSWVLSNYFYLEMGMTLRWLLLPFLMLFTLSVIILAGRALERVRVLPTTFFHGKFRHGLGRGGLLVDGVIWVNSTVILFLLVLAVPAYLVMRDARSTLSRYGVNVADDLKESKDRHYVAAAEAVFRADPSVAAYIYGHTHSASVREMDGRYIINTGTWLKKMERVQPRVGMLPAVYVPTYRLNYYVISSAGENVLVEYHIIPKEVTDGLTLLQRAVLMGKRSVQQADSIPSEFVIRP